MMWPWKSLTLGLSIAISASGCVAASPNVSNVGAATTAALKQVAAPRTTAIVKASCDTPVVRLDINFPSGNVNSCEVVGPKRLKVTITPEDSGKINDSPWYAFRLTPKKSGRITVELHYKGGHHRYWPKMSNDGANWKRLPRKSVILKEPKKNKEATLKIKLRKAPTFVAAQEIIVPATYDAWIRGLTNSFRGQRFLLGQSAEKRQIPGVVIGNRAAKEQVVIVGRQHPPEITGALALFPFVDAIASNDPIAKKYRERFETIVVPMLNPDGVVRGHWRHNTGGTDLNRDWGPFKQPETKLMDTLLKDIAKNSDQKLRFFLDFHSTQEDVFYTIPDENPTEPKLFIRDWLANMQARLPKYNVNRNQNHNAATTVSKAYVYETYRAPAVTYELGDETDRKQIIRTAHQSALAMMETLLATPAQ